MKLMDILPLVVAGAPLVSSLMSGTAGATEAKGFMDITKKFLGADKKDAKGLQERIQQAGFTLPNVVSYAPAGQSDKAQVRAMREALQQLFDKNNFSIKTGMDTLANAPLMEAMYRKNKVSNYDIYSKSTSSASAAPTIGLGTEKLS